MAKKNRTDNLKLESSLTSNIDDLNRLYAYKVSKKFVEVNKRTNPSYYSTGLIDMITASIFFSELELIMRELNISMVSEILYSIDKMGKMNLDYIAKTIDKSIDIGYNVYDKEEYVTSLIYPSINKIKRDIQNTIKASVLKGEPLDEANRKIYGLVYSKNNVKRSGLVARAVRILRTELTKQRTESKLKAIEELRRQGYKIKRSWVYTWESKEPRREHVLADGQVEDDNGYFTVSGYKTKGPGLFGVLSEDINCRCDTEVESVE